MKVIFLLLNLISIGSILPDPDNKIESGKKLYNENCTPCHMIDDDLIGPKLRDITLKRDSVWLYKWTTRSQKLIQSGDTAAVAVFRKYSSIMQPDFRLSPTQVDNIYQYIKSAPRK